MDGEVEFLEKLIGIPSVTCDVVAVNRAVAVVRERMSSHGVWCAAERMEDGRDALFASNDGIKTPDVLLCVHLDVVPADDPGQFMPRREGDLVFGRGSWDCKGHCTVACRLLSELKGKVSVGCIFSTDEETGRKSVASMLDRGYGARRLVIVLDCAPYALTTRHKGLELDEENPVLVDFLGRMRAKWPEREVGFLHLKCYTDAVPLQRLGLPTLVFGAEGYGSHAAEEHVRISSLDETFDLLADYLRERFAR